VNRRLDGSASIRERMRDIGQTRLPAARWGNGPIPDAPVGLAMSGHVLGYLPGPSERPVPIEPYLLRDGLNESSW